MTRKEILNALDEIIDEAAYMKNAYFRSAPKWARQRRDYEQQHSHPLIEWEEGGHQYSAEYVVNCSCKNIYATGYYYKDGKRTTLVAIKNSYLRMRDELK